MIKNKLKIAAIGMSVLLSSSSAFSMENFKSIFPGKTTTHEKEKKKALSKVPKSDFFKRAHVMIDFQTGDESTDFLHKLIIDELIRQYPDMQSYWTSKTVVDGREIHQNHKLYDMERHAFDKVELAENVGVMSVMKSGDVTRAKAIDTRITRHRLAQGMPGVDPYNDDIYVCKFVNHSNAPYYEMAKRDAERLLIITKSTLKNGGACLNNQEYRTYFKLRRNDFIDSQGDDIIPR